MLDFPSFPTNGQIFVAPNGVTYTYQSPPGRWNDLGGSGAYPPRPPGIEYLPYLTGTAVESTLSIQAAFDRLATIGGGILQLPSGIVPYTATPATQIAPNEGLAFLLGPQHSNIVVRGAGKGVTIMKPASNKIESFVQNGAANLTFEGITFDNSANGVLQNTPKVNNAGPGTGVAGLGNGANCAIRQYEGAGLVIRNCEFLQFGIAIEYIGSFANKMITVGDHVSDGNWFDGCIQPHLPHQPRTLRVTNAINKNNIDSVNFDGTIDPGHLIYLTDRSAAHPDTIVVDNVQDLDSKSCPIKLRKGKVVSVSNCSLFNCGRSLDIEGIQNGTFTNITVSAWEDPLDNSQTSAWFLDCGSITLSDSVFDLTGVSTFGIRVSSGAPVDSWSNVGFRINDVTFIHDHAIPATQGKTILFIENQTAMEINNVIFLHRGTVANTRFPMQLFGVKKSRIKRFSHRTPDAVTPLIDGDMLIQLDAACSDNIMELSATDIDKAWDPANTSTSTVNDAGTNNRVFRVDGTQSGSYLPVASFVTNGDFVPTYTRQQGYWTRKADIVTVFVSLVFNANAYTTAASSFQITLPFASGSSATMALWGVGAGNFQNIVFGSGTDIEVVNNAGSAQANLRTALTASAGAYLTTTSVPASASNVTISFQMTYKITEP